MKMKLLNNNCEIKYHCGYSGNHSDDTCVYAKFNNVKTECSYYNYYDESCNSAVAQVNRMVLTLKEMGINNVERAGI